jgi:hypothetical protein
LSRRSASEEQEVECTFKSRNSVAESDFSVNVTDASTADLKPADARVFVSGVYAR